LIVISNSKLEPIILVKRKVFTPLFNNPYIVKVYKQNKAISNNLILKQIEKAKNANKGTVKYIKKKLLLFNLY
jgi:hypothetical protein